MLGAQPSNDPCDVFKRFLDKQQRLDQFSENMHKVVHTGPGESAGSRGARTPKGAAGRTRSPGLAAGAVLALSGGSTPAEVHAEAHAARLQSVGHARRRDCPFDDHSAFGAKAGELGPRPQHLPAPGVEQAQMVLQTSKSLGRQIRDHQRKIGHGAPWDAPEHEPATSSSITAVKLAPQQSQALADAQVEMARNRSRMRGSGDLISGGYLQGDSTASRRNTSLPPRPPMELLPQAQIRLTCGGGSTASLTQSKAAYLNSVVLADSSRMRNEGVNLRLA